ncbi:MAG: glycosyltransferase [Deltaproteobacteria bacterium]|nr:glycosyltransferase [Deltaproteobacteria bacterium]NIS76058.1 glycosyltransferase [Deltaproteobacteria bacterium]
MHETLHMKPAVSVLMPVYNAASTLPASIGSVLGQTFSDLELICVDDGSTDASARLIGEARRRDPRVRLIRGRRRGIVAALNRGLRACSGTYVARMDADDIMDEERIERQLRFFNEAGQFDLIGARVRMISDSGFLSSGVVRYEGWSNSLTEHDDIVREIFVESPLVHPTFFLGKEYYEKMGGYRGSPWAEDYDLILRAYLAGARFGKVPETLLLWRDSAGRLIRNDARCKREAMFRAKVHYFVKKGLLEKRRSAVIAGSGPSGREVARLLLCEGVTIACFVDNREDPGRRTVMGIPAFGFPSPAPEGFFRAFAGSYFIVCIGDDAGRRDFVSGLERASLRQGKNFMRFL